MDRVHNQEEVIKALESRGAVRREGQDVRAKLENLYEEFLG